MKYRLVLIDDSALVLEIMSSVLSDAGFEVRAMSSLRHFVNNVMDWNPHLIVTDLHMPDMSGAEVCAWLRKQMQTARIPIVFCSSAPESELKVLCQQVGADGYVSKQAGPEALAKRMLELCEQIVF
jgi:twitching motility two-component system response regulator PilH